MILYCKDSLGSIDNNNIELINNMSHCGYLYITKIWFKSRRGKNKNLTALKSNSNTVWFNFQTYILDFRAVKFLFFPRRDLNPHHCYTAAPFA